MDKQTKILKGLICPYCGEDPKLINSVEIYREDHGLLWACIPCHAWVGVHKGTTTPLGRLANSELRRNKIQAHSYFDPLWKKKIDQGFSKRQARMAAYTWLAGQMNIPVSLCHVGMFDVDQCKQVVSICKAFYRHEHQQSFLTKKNISNE